MAIFQFFKMAAVRYLGFSKVGNLTSGFIRRPNMRHRTKFREDWSNRSGDMADFRFFMPQFQNVKRDGSQSINQ